MFRNFGISKYHFGVILIYLFLTPLVIAVIKPEYNLKSENLLLSVIVAIGTLLIFYVGLSFFVARRKELDFALIVKVLFYAAIFAFAEEVIFRGLVQGVLQSVFIPVLAVLLASIIFGLAHLLNGAACFQVRDLNWRFAVLTFLAGLPLGTLFALTHSLFLPTLLHFLFVLLLQLFTYREWVQTPSSQRSRIDFIPPPRTPHA